MALSVRKRGDIWHARGTIRIGQTSIVVPEFSTGAGSKADAEAIAGAHEARLRQEHLEGDAGKARRLTFADCALLYLKRPGGVESYDKDRIHTLTLAFGMTPIAEVNGAFHKWVSGRSWEPATAQRWRAIVSAVVKHGCKIEGVPQPAIEGWNVPQGDRVVSLTPEERHRLICAYNPHAAQPALLLAYAGLRTQEALQLDWRHVDFDQNHLVILRGTERAGLSTAKGKARHSRVVPMHRRVRLLLVGLWEAAGRPRTGKVFISAKGKPYANTRGKGGNPLDQAHDTACRKAGILIDDPEGERDPATGRVRQVIWFRPHDWRHDFALRFLNQGGDIRSLMQVMGWTQMRMVQRYVAYKKDHLDRIMRDMNE